MSSKIPSDREGLEAYVGSLEREKKDLETRVETLRTTYPELIAQGDADGALQVKKELESIPVKLEIVEVKVQSAQAKLSVLLANEPKAQEVRKEITEKWSTVRVVMEDIDAIGEKLRKDFEKLKNLEKELTSLGYRHSSLTGVPPTYPRLQFCQESDIPKFLNPYREKRPFSLWIVERPWREWTYRPPEPQTE